MDCGSPDSRALPRLSRRPKAAKGPRTEPPLETRQRFRLPQLQSSQTVPTDLKPIRTPMPLTSDVELPPVGKTMKMPCYSMGYEPRMTVLRKTSNSRLLTDAGLCDPEALTLYNVDAALPLKATTSSRAVLKESRMLDRREKAKPTMMPQSEKLVSDVLLPPDWTQPMKTRKETATTPVSSHKLTKKSSAIRTEPSLLPFEDTFEPRETSSVERMKLLRACVAGMPQQAQDGLHTSLGETDSKKIWIKAKARNERMKLYDVGRDSRMESCEDKSEHRMETCEARCVSAMCLKVDEPAIFPYDGQIQLITSPSMESNDRRMNDEVKMESLPEKIDWKIKCEDTKIAKEVSKSEELKPCDGKSAASIPSLDKKIQELMDEVMEDVGKWHGKSKESGIDSGSDCILPQMMLDEEKSEVGTHFFANWHEDMMESCEVTSESGMDSCSESDCDSPLLDIFDLKKETSVTSNEQKIDSLREMDVKNSTPAMEAVEEKVALTTPELEAEQKPPWLIRAEDRKKRVGSLIRLECETSDESDDKKMDITREVKESTMKPCTEKTVEKKTSCKKDKVVEISQPKAKIVKTAEARRKRVESPIRFEYETSDESDDEKMDIKREMQESTVKPCTDEKVERKTSCKAVKVETSQLEAEMKLSWMDRAEARRKRVESQFGLLYETSDKSDDEKMDIRREMQESTVKPCIDERVERKTSCKEDKVVETLTLEAEMMKSAKERKKRVESLIGEANETSNKCNAEKTDITREMQELPVKACVEKKVEKISCEVIKAVEKLPSLGSLEKKNKRSLAKEGPEMKLYEKMIMQMSSDEEFGARIEGHRKGSVRKHQFKEMDEVRMTTKKDRNAPKMMVDRGNGARRGELRMDSAMSCTDHKVDDESENRTKIRQALREEKKKVKTGAAVRIDEDKNRQSVKIQGPKNTTTGKASKMPQNRLIADCDGVQLAEYTDRRTDRIRTKSQSNVDSARVMHFLENGDIDDSETKMPQKAAVFADKSKDSRYSDARPSAEADPYVQRTAYRKGIQLAEYADRHTDRIRMKSQSNVDSARVMHVLENRDIDDSETKMPQKAAVFADKSKVSRYRGKQLSAEADPYVQRTAYRKEVQPAEYTDHRTDKIRMKSQSYVDSARVMHVLENRDIDDSETKMPQKAAVFADKSKDSRYRGTRPSAEADPYVQRNAARRPARGEAMLPSRDECSRNAAPSTEVPCMVPHPPSMPRKNNIRIKSCKARSVRQGPSLKETMEKVASQWDQAQPHVEQPSGYGYYEPKPPPQSKKAESRRQTYMSRMKSDSARKQHQELNPSAIYRSEKGMPSTSGVRNASPRELDDFRHARGYPAENRKDFDDAREQCAGSTPWPVFLESLDSKKR